MKNVHASQKEWRVVRVAQVVPRDKLRKLFSGPDSDGAKNIDHRYSTNDVVALTLNRASRVKLEYGSHYVL
eukprot:2483326-Pleurochrysis_carterae.AAC.1